MNKQIASFFDRFYNIALKDKIQDPLLHSEWNYFQSMISGNTFERERINMYLGILENERKKKQKVSEVEFNSLIQQPRIQKKLSEPVRNLITNENERLFTKEDNNREITKSPKTMTPNTKYRLKKTAIADCQENNSTSSGSKSKNPSEKPDYKKLSEIANNLVRVFQIRALD